MTGNSNAVSSAGGLSLDVGGELTEDSFRPVDLGTGAAESEDDPKGSPKRNANEDEDDGDEDQPGASRGGDSDDDDPDDSTRRVRAARRGERKAKTRSSRIEKQMVRLAVEVDNLKNFATQAVVGNAKERADQAQARYRDAYAKRTKAFEEGKADDFNSADAEIKAAEADYAAAVREVQSTPQANPVATGLRERWMANNEWFDPDGNDKDSEFARQLSREIVRDGYPPNSQRHFDELDARMRAARPKLFAGGDDEGEDEEDDRDDRGARRESQKGGQGGRQRDRGPRGGAHASERNGNDGGAIDYTKNTKVPRALIENYRAAGFDVEDPKIRDRMVKQYNATMQSMSGGRVDVH